MRKGGKYVQDEPYFTGEVFVDGDGRVVWEFSELKVVKDEKGKDRERYVHSRRWAVLSQHKAKGRRRSSRNGVYCTPGGVR